MATSQPDDTGLSILVVRSGGFTGIPQRWHVEPGSGTDADDWIALVAACPWGAVGRDLASRDRFVWRIEARIPPRVRTAAVPDRDLIGPWRALVDRVQEAGARG